VQRKTPTVIHKHFSIQRIRQFYIRKIKFVQNKYNHFILEILNDFPPIDHLHPFFTDFFNILFNKNCYKIALNRLYRSKSIIVKISKNYIKLVKYEKSFYGCKHLKKNALGRIVKVIKKLNPCFIFLEKIRQYLGKLPLIDPHRKSILINGCSSTGKSSLMKKLTKANVNVGFNDHNTKILSIGHFSGNFSRWQIIDSPGINNYQIKFLTSIEMQTINTIAHFDCLVIQILDPSETSPFSLPKQFEIFVKLKKLVYNKKKLFIFSKTDLGWEKVTHIKKKGVINTILNHQQGLLPVFKTSFHDDIGLSSIREAICSSKKDFEKDWKTFFFKKNRLNHFSLKNQKFAQKVSFYRKNESDLNLFGATSEKNSSLHLNLKEYVSAPNIIPWSVSNFFFDNPLKKNISKKKKKSETFEKENKLRELNYEQLYLDKNLIPSGKKHSKPYKFRVAPRNKNCLEGSFLKF